MFQGVITANDDEHRRRRRLLMPVAQRAALDYYRQVFAETYGESRFADTANGTPFDVVAELLAISKRNMLRGMLGVTDNEANRRLASDILELSAGVTNPGVILVQINKPWTPYGKWVGKVSSAYARLAALIEERRLSPGRPGCAVHRLQHHR